MFFLAHSAPGALRIVIIYLTGERGGHNAMQGVPKRQKMGSNFAGSSWRPANVRALPIKIINFSEGMGCITTRMSLRIYHSSLRLRHAWFSH